MVSQQFGKIYPAPLGVNGSLLVMEILIALERVLARKLIFYFIPNMIMCNFS